MSYRNGTRGRARTRFAGAIAGMGTASGTRVVVGRWASSPFGDFVDVMVQGADGHRTLLAPNADIAAFVSQTYGFDEVRVVEVRLDEIRADAAGNPSGAPHAAPGWYVRAGPLALSFGVGDRTALGMLLRLLPGRLAAAPWFAAAADPLARLLFNGVRTRGAAGGGRREWYAVTDEHRIVRLRATWEGADLGALAPVDPPVCFGFGSTPVRPSVVSVTTTVEDRCSRGRPPPAAAAS